MPQSGYTIIQLYNTTTPGAVPSASNLQQGELAINVPDGKLFYKNISGVVTQFQTAGASGYSGYSGYSGSGISGYSGYSGFGASGYSGFSGYSGTPAPTVKGLGLNGETWQNVGGSRAFGTTYTNNFTYPIMVSVCQSALDGGVIFYINGSAIAQNYVVAGGTGAGTVTIIVPPGATYSATAAYGPTGSFTSWWELF